MRRAGTVSSESSTPEVADYRFRAAFDNAPIGMALLDAQGAVEQVNAALCALLERTPRDLVGAPLPWWTASLARTDDVTEGRDRGPIRLELSSGRAVWIAQHMQPIGDPQQPGQTVVQVTDESERYQHEQLLTHVADHDSLTGLLNRRAFEQALQRHHTLFSRHRAQGALLLLDVDHFKYINDTRGHQAGDQVLVKLADVLTARLRDTDLIGRLGGDEFAVLLSHGDLRAATAVATDLLEAARSITLTPPDGTRRLSISIGVTTLDATLSGAAEALAHADRALYEAKQSGRNQQVVADAHSHVASQTRVTTLDRIENALSHSTVQLDLQPLLDLRSDQLTEHELLVRLPHPDGRVPARAWFPLAERYGLGPAVDQWVLEQALALMEQQPKLRLSVNISALSLSRADWRAQLRGRLTDAGLDGSRLTFEISETASMSNVSATTAFMDDVRELGCRLALDDFGAGYGSFYHLKHLPYDDIKIHSEFVTQSVHSPLDQAVLRAMVDVAHTGGQRTIAEAVEDAETLELLRNVGVDLAQGYHVARPAPARSNVTVSS